MANVGLIKNSLKLRLEWKVGLLVSKKLLFRTI